MRIARWGNSLAVRLPASLVAELQLNEGDDLEVRVVAARVLEVGKDERRQRAMAEIARLARPLPPGYRFDREEANARGFDDEP